MFPAFTAHNNRRREQGAGRPQQHTTTPLNRSSVDHAPAVAYFDISQSCASAPDPPSVSEFGSPCDFVCSEVLVSSFSFKTGPPCSSNVITDVRCLPDPKVLEEAYPYITGQHPEVKTFLRGHSGFQPFFDELCATTSRVMRDMARCGYERINLAFGCTAGKHRSVFVAEALAEWLRNTHGGVTVRVEHRDMCCDEDMTGSSASSASTESYDSGTADIDMTFMGESSPTGSVGCDEAAEQPEITYGKWHDGPVVQLSYHPDQNRFEISEHSKWKPCSTAVHNVLGNGIANLKSLRNRRAHSAAEPQSTPSGGGHNTIRRMGLVMQPHSL